MRRSPAEYALSRLTFAFAALVLSTASSVLGQATDPAFVQGYDAFIQQDYDEALSMFISSDSERAHLFAGKAAFMAGRCAEGLPYLRSAIDRTDGSEVKMVEHEDALFTMAQCRVQLRQYGPALETLGRLSREASTPLIRRDAGSLYHETLAFLSSGQLLRIAKTTDDPSLLSDLRRVAQSGSDSLLMVLTRDPRRIDESNVISPVRQTARAARAPSGFVHSVRVALPWSSSDPGVFQASKSLYQGLLLSIEQNNETSASHIQLKLVDSNPEMVAADSLVSLLVGEEPADLILGPLFSSTAESIMAAVAAYRLPVITPLANSDQILSAQAGIIQLNPPFSLQGVAMARHAVLDLGLDTLGILADRTSLGYAAASAFRLEAERLGAYVPVYFAEDLASTGYDITPFAAHLETDPVLLDSLRIIPLKGVYAPFTGQQASTLIQLLLTEMEAKKSKAVILGTEEWDSDVTRSLLPDEVRVHYSALFNPDPDETKVAAIEEAFLQKYGTVPDDLAWIGFDVGTLIGRLVSKEPNPDLWMQTLPSMPPVEGVMLRFDLDGGRANRSVRIRSLAQGAESDS